MIGFMEVDTYILVCPVCGAKKEVAFSSKITPDSPYEFWSDSRIECKNWLEVAHTQLCSSCGRYFSLPQISTLQKGSAVCRENGRLTYHQLKEAIVQLAGDEFAEPWARLEAWWSFNALYKDANAITEDEVLFNRSNMEWLVNFHTPRTKRFSHLLFELNRLLGNNDVCADMISRLTYEEYKRQREERNREKGITSKLGEDILHDMYVSQIEYLEHALAQPLKPFIRS